jgi:hypothetical protein
LYQKKYANADAVIKQSTKTLVKRIISFM